MTRVDGTVLITGATGGIGQAIARAFAREGASTILTGRRAEVLEPLAGELGGRAIACDLSDPGDITRLLEQAGEIDVLIANAALPGSGPLLDFTPEQIDRAIDVNLRAPMQLARALADRMRARGEGHLVFISSLAGKSSAPGSAVYSATKFGLRGFALGLREDLHGSGVGVSTIFPGFIRNAGMYADAGEPRLSPGVGTRTPEQVAGAVLRAIRTNRPEIDVAPLPLRLGATLAGVAPGLTARVQRRLGSERVSAELASRQADKR